MKKSAFVLLFLSMVMVSLAQSSSYTVPPPKFNLGLGVGVDYGGIGIQAQYNHLPFLGIGIGLGYNFVDIGVHGSVFGRLLSDKRFSPFLRAGYGYVAALKVVGASEYDKSYYGPSVGIGFDYKNRRMRNFFVLSVNYNFKPDSFQNDFDRAEADGVEFDNQPIPISVSLAYHFGL